MIKKVFGIFRVKQEERWLALAVVLWLTAHNVLTIVRHYDTLTRMMAFNGKRLTAAFRMSGFDPLTYGVVTDWDTYYNVYRHPLLPFFMYPAYLLNLVLEQVTGINCSLFVMAVVIVFCSFYAFLFLYRILREVMGLGRKDASVLSVMCFALAYVMITSMVPDHFVISMLMLVITLYICGKMQQRDQTLSIWQTVVFFFFTAGTSLNNGIKVFMAAFFTNGRRFFNWKYLLLAVLLPCAVIWKGARLEYHYFVWPKEMARKEASKKKDKELRADMVRQYLDTAQVRDTAAAVAHMKQMAKKRAQAKYKRDHQKFAARNMGKPMANGEFSRWTDISTSRWETAVHNLFGEGLLLHADYLMKDALVDRPVIVKYRYWSSYVAELMIVVLFLMGIVCGMRKRFFWTAFSFFLYDMALHMGLGFGINEVYIMTAHWAFIIPIAVGCLLLSATPRQRRWLRVVLLVLTGYIIAHNEWLLWSYMTGW